VVLVSVTISLSGLSTPETFPEGAVAAVEVVEVLQLSVANDGSEDLADSDDDVSAAVVSKVPSPLSDASSWLSFQ